LLIIGEDQPAIKPARVAMRTSIDQTFWNALSDRPVAEGGKDYDLFYFDEDLSYEAVQRARTLFADLDVLIDVKNQARMHLWYPQRFGGDYPAGRGRHRPIFGARDLKGKLTGEPMQGPAQCLFVPKLGA
jgi:hypothetical protein